MVPEGEVKLYIPALEDSPSSERAFQQLSHLQDRGVSSCAERESPVDRSTNDEDFSDD